MFEQWKEWTVHPMPATAPVVIFRVADDLRGLRWQWNVVYQGAILASFALLGVPTDICSGHEAKALVTWGQY